MPAPFLKKNSHLRLKDKLREITFCINFVLHHSNRYPRHEVLPQERQKVSDAPEQPRSPRAPKCDAFSRTPFLGGLTCCRSAQVVRGRGRRGAVPADLRPRRALASVRALESRDDVRMAAVFALLWRRSHSNAWQVVGTGSRLSCAQIRLWRPCQFLLSRRFDWAAYVAAGGEYPADRRLTGLEPAHPFAAAARDSLQARAPRRLHEHVETRTLLYATFPQRPQPTKSAIEGGINNWHHSLQCKKEVHSCCIFFNPMVTA